MIARLRDEVGDTGLLALVRVCLGVLLLRQSILAARLLVQVGYFGEFFHMPMIPAALVPSHAVYVSVLCALIVLAVAVIVGRGARPALFVSSVLGVWLMLCDRLQLHNNRWALLCFAFLLSFSPCDRALVVRRAHEPRPPREGPLFMQRLMQAQLAIIYLASSTSKLLDPDWRDGVVLATRIARYGYRDAPKWLHWLIDLLVRPEVASIVAKGAIATELFLAIGLFFPRTRVGALWLGLAFHLTIEITSKVEAFTWLTLAIYALFATPDRHARALLYDAGSSRGRAIASLVRVLDWLGRFAITPADANTLPAHRAVVVVRRDGTRVDGARALAAVTRCLPLTFVVWPLLALVTRAAGGGNERRATPRARS